MSEECNHDCSSCGTTCGDDTRRTIPYEEPNELSNIRHTIAVVSGKGGVGKSLVTGLLAVAMSRKGCHVGIMDADITGPSVPKMFGVSGEILGNQAGAYPVSSAGGIDIVSMNLFLEDTSDPVVWRGPVISGVVKQFWQDVIWNDVDYLFIDMPPGTGDVPLTVMQSIKLDGIVIVTSPQELVSMIVEKAVKMASVMKVPILGIVENMSYFECPDCGKQHKIYGESHLEEIAKEYNLDILGRIPIQPNLAAKCDAGQIETVDSEYLQAAVDKLLAGDKK
ncbi:MAG: Mrp/NBP35 family ATP-binding protein [Anaerovibrio sp.]|uniref:Mrp/NBP35 family ATP-binding protein n=1 Tax=Anaerovibrio sp. TaxID=1872532 RepID=UPI0025C3ED38|nr:Mrp/NBP35 family ATP-binding protein [Anaerovibrio sp.]MBE6099958.1 Mrp/NBP35 family ATP-binding protein [Anaerovibrio sp.]MBQ3853564.1 Mrp/NBP35 family ATP-binding protein [Anaerovibrio sp.]